MREENCVYERRGGGKIIEKRRERGRHVNDNKHIA